MSVTNDQVCLSKAAIWLPEGYEDAQYISEQSGVPVDVVQNKMGIIKKCRANKDEHPAQMAINAAKKVLKDIDPLSVDMIIWTGSEYKEYMVWSAGIYVQEQLGLKNAFAFDIAARCSTNVVGLKVAKAMMDSDPTLKRVLLCGGHKTGDLVNYKDPTSRFLYNLSDGASAMFLERGNTNPILESSVITDGAFSEDVIIRAGGTKLSNKNDIKLEDTFLTCPDITGMRERLADRSIDNFLSVIKTAAQASMKKPIDYLCLLHMKKSAHDAIVHSLELKDEQCIYMDTYGHFGAPDQVLSLGLAQKRNQLKEGDHVVFASAGIGYTWSAISIRYDKPIFTEENLKEL